MYLKYLRSTTRNHFYLSHVSLCLLTAQRDWGARNALTSGALPTIKHHRTFPLSSIASIITVYACVSVTVTATVYSPGTNRHVSQNTLITSRRRRYTPFAYMCSDHNATYICKHVWSAVELTGRLNLMQICLCYCLLFSTRISHFMFHVLAIFVRRKDNCFLYLQVHALQTGCMVICWCPLFCERKGLRSEHYRGRKSQLHVLGDSSSRGITIS